VSDTHASLDRAWLLAVELDDGRDARNAQRVADLPSSGDEQSATVADLPSSANPGEQEISFQDAYAEDGHAFCREHRSWFCPCAAPWMYEGGPALTPTGFWGREYIARAWDEPKLARSIWKRRREEEDESGQGLLL
jgi:hypothetical protein